MCSYGGTEETNRKESLLDVVLGDPVTVTMVGRESKRDGDKKGHFFGEKAKGGILKKIRRGPLNSKPKRQPFGKKLLEGRASRGLRGRDIVH